MRATWSATLCLLLGCVLVVEWQQYKTLQSVAPAYPILISKQEAEQLVTTWMSGGSQRATVTTRKLGESNADWQKRHFDAVKKDQITWPPDP